ncbi:MAG: hypothetical protein QOH06_4448 [Acidobacteriota bacterium]|nr:hypothetical protein [Acidobacteriota bacterium]
MRAIACIVFVLALALRPVEAQKAGVGASVGGTEERKDALLVYGEGFAFSVKEPWGWRGDIEAARKYGANIVFFPEAAESRSAEVTIRLRVNDKVDENTASDLEADRDSYKSEYPKVQFGKLDVRHPQYGTFSELFFQPGAFYEYVSYLNPGPKSKISISVAMSKARSAATKNELEAYEMVLGSLTVLSDSLEVIQKPGSYGDPGGRGSRGFEHHD